MTTPPGSGPRKINYARDLGDPGQFPFTRGIHPKMYHERPWTMRQYAGYGTAKESNQHYKYLLSHGQTGLSVAFDLPTQIGYDSDHERAEGEIGRVGVAISTIEDMETLFDGIPLDKVSTSMTINATAAILLAFYLAIADEQKVPWEKLSGTTQNDILKEYIARGTYIFPPGPSLRLTTDLMAFCAERVPKWNSISVGGYHMREMGATAAQEIAFTLSDGIAYLKAVKKAGIDVERVAQRVSFFFSADIHFLEEVAKFRALRRMWANIVKKRFKIANKRAQMLRFHVQTAGSTLTAQQPDNNVVRTTIEALAAVLGGAQSLHTNSKDEALGLPTKESALLALRTQQIMLHEAGVTGAADPLGGSYYIEGLTDQLESEASGLIAEIERRGGMVKAIETGFVQREILRTAYEFQQAVEQKKEIIVGVNAYQSEMKKATPIFKLNARNQKEQRERVRRFKQRRDSNRIAKCLEKLERAARGKDNLIPLFIEAVKNKVTLGEICAVLRSVFGEYRPAAKF
ncbi:MAG: methylmalonyl-CoA mutase family protein [bacterium]